MREVYPRLTVLVYLMKDVVSEELKHVSVTGFAPLNVTVKPCQ